MHLDRTILRSRSDRYRQKRLRAKSGRHGTFERFRIHHRRTHNYCSVQLCIFNVTHTCGPFLPLFRDRSTDRGLLTREDPRGVIAICALPSPAVTGSIISPSGEKERRDAPRETNGARIRSACSEKQRERARAALAAEPRVRQCARTHRSRRRRAHRRRNVSPGKRYRPPVGGNS